MSMISEHLKAEIIDPSLPRDAFIPPSHDEDEDYDDINPADIVDVEDDGYVE